MSAVPSLPLSACQFPDYGFASGRGGSAGSEAPDGSAADSGGPDTPDEPGGAGGAGGAEASPCRPEQACVTGAPSSWVGPIAFWEGKASDSDAPPDCPHGYGKPIDLHRGLDAPAGPCSCTCAAQDQVCDENTTLNIFADRVCESPCATVSPKACTAVSGCTGSQGSLRGAKPTPSGGSCQANVSGPGPVTWQYDARICPPSDAFTCDDPSQVCAPTPPSPFATQLCVMRVIRPGQSQECPADYPNRSEDLFGAFSDQRACSECGCGEVSGGTCSGTLTISDGDDCSTGIQYELGSACQMFDLGQGMVHPSNVGGKYTVVAGTCNVASPPQPTGSAAPSGNITVVCCP